MKKVLILCAHRPGRSPSQRYRFEQFLPFLEEKGFSFIFSYLLSEKHDKIFYSPGNFLYKVLIIKLSVFKRIRDMMRFRKFDIIFIQREAGFLGISYFEKKAFCSGAKVIFDFDDSIWLADTSPGNLKWEWLKKPDKFFRNLSYAHQVIAGNSWLAEKARQYNKNVAVIPTTIDTDIHVPKPKLRGSAKVIIGWSGSISTIKHFELLLPVLKNLRKKYGERIGFRIIGQTGYSHPDLPVDSLPWHAETEADDLNSFDIGLMPLPDDEWSRGKCGLKALSYMACGVPAVLSEVGMNRAIISHGRNGFLAENDSEWYYLLCALIEDPELRNEIGMAGRKTVVDRYSVAANKGNYLEVFKKEI